MRLSGLLLGALALLLASAPAWARTVRVKDVAGLVAAVKAAQAGDEIVLADGTYALADKIRAVAAGTAAAPIVIRAEHRWKAMVRSGGEIAFEVRGPNWTIQDLDVRGVCKDDAQCEHAVHVVGAATGFRLLGNRLVDFNAQLKVNADGARVIPSGGLTLLHTVGIDFRFASSSGEAHGNLASTYIHDRDDATHTDGGNLSGDISDDVLDGLYKDARAGDLRLAADAAGLAKAGVAGTGGEDPHVKDDFCGRPRTPSFDMGALQSSLGDCPTVK